MSTQRQQQRAQDRFRVDLLTIRLAHWRDRALDAETKINDLYNRLDQMAAQIEQLRLQIEEYQYADRESGQESDRKKQPMTEEEMFRWLAKPLADDEQ